MLFQQANLLSLRCCPLLVTNAVVTPQSYTRTSCHVLWQLVRCFAISCKTLTVAYPPQKLVAWLSGIDARWCTVTAVNTSLGMSVSVTNSLKNTKEYNGFDSFSTEAQQILQSALSFFSPVKCETSYARRVFFSLAQQQSFLSLCHVFQPPSRNIFLAFFLCSVLAVVLPSLLSATTTMHPLGRHLPLIQHFLSVLYFFLQPCLFMLLLNCVRPMK